MEGELKSIGQQLQYTLDELGNNQPDTELMHDWVSDSLHRVKQLLGESNEVISCEIYEPERDVNMNCKHCGQPQFMHYR